VYKTFICLRYLAKKRITWFSVISVLLGVMALVVVMSVMHGFTRFMRESMQGMLADVVVRSPASRGFDHYERLMEEIGQVPGVVASAPRITKFGLAQTGYGRESSLSAITISGIIPELEDKVSVRAGKEGGGFRSMVGLPLDRSGNVQRDEEEEREEERPWEGEDVRGMNWTLTWDDPESVPAEARDAALCIAGSQVLGGRFFRSNNLAAALIGWMRVKITTIGMEAGEPSERYFTLANTISTGNYEYDSGRIFITLEAAQSLTRMKGAVTEIHVKTAASGRAAIAEMSRQIQAVIDRADYIEASRRPTASPWFSSAENAILLNAFRLETLTMYILLFLLLVVAGFATIAILTLIVLQKTKDIGVLMAMGAAGGGIRRVFLTFGLAIGILGATLGLAGGLVFLWQLEPIRSGVSAALGFDPFPADLFYFSEIPKEYSAARFAATWAAAVGLCLLAAAYPAYRASRLKPVEIIRYE